MTLDKAIEILHRHFILHFDVPLAELNKAAELGIEAIERELERRHKELFRPYTLLLGETED